MRILFGTIELAAGPIRASVRPGGPFDISINARRLVQEAQFIRAAQVTMFDRGNLKTTIRFSVRRQHATVQDSEYWLLTHTYAVQEAATAIFMAESTSGSRVELYLASAVLGVSDHLYKGVGTYHTYTIEGGKFTAQKP
jgi:hypothetical protein